MWGSLRRCGRLLVGLLAVTVGGFAWTACPALAGSTTSVNWSGYAAHRPGVHFRSVTGEWLVPTATCAAGSSTYSSIWIGLGGYSASSNALEQAGTEIDCSSAGRAKYFAWYELIPAVPASIQLGVRPGDLIRGTVTAAGGRVTVVLADLTDGRTFRRSFHPSQIDTTSAEWILEAPSGCTNSGRCFTLPLADFRHASLFGARAVTSGGRTGTIKSRWWNSTMITLTSQGSRFVADTANQSAQAIPSALTAGGSAFTVTYHAPAEPLASPGPFFGVRASPLLGGQLRGSP